MSWKGVAVLSVAFAWFGSTCVLAGDAGKHVGKPCGKCRHASGEQAPAPAPSACPECAEAKAREARSAEIAALRAEIAKARAELAELRRPAAPQAPQATAAPKADAPWLGLQVAEGGCGRLEVTGVAAGSPAAAAGVQKGDTLLLWGTQGVLCVKDLADLAAQVNEGGKACVTVLRGHAWIQAEVTRPAAAPAQPAQPAEQPAQPAEQPAQPAEEPAQPAEQPAQPEGQPEEQPPAEEPK